MIGRLSGGGGGSSNASGTGNELEEIGGTLDRKKTSMYVKNQCNKAQKGGGGGGG